MMSENEPKNNGDNPTDENVINFAEQCKKFEKDIESDEITIENYNKVTVIIQEILKRSKKFDCEQLNHEVESINVDIQEACEFNYDKKLKEVAAYRDYFIEHEGKVKAYVSWHNKCIELLTSYVLLLSKQKTIELKKNEANVRLQSYHMDREFYVDLLTRLEYKRESFSKKYDAISRLLSYWDTMTKVDSSRNVNRPK